MIIPPIINNGEKFLPVPRTGSIICSAQLLFSARNKKMFILLIGLVFMKNIVSTYKILFYFIFNVSFSFSAIRTFFRLFIEFRFENLVYRLVNIYFLSIAISFHLILLFSMNKDQ